MIDLSLISMEFLRKRDRMNLDLKKYEMYIDGAFCEAENGATAENINPSTGQVINT